MVLRTIPPIPVAAFGDKQFFERQFALLLRTMLRRLLVEVASMVKIVPGLVVFRRADPDIEVGVNPGAGRQRMEDVDVAVPRNGLGKSKRFDRRIILQGIVEASQEFASGLGIVFPGVFTVQNDGYDSILTARYKRLRAVLNVMD